MSDYEKKDFENEYQYNPITPEEPEKAPEAVYEADTVFDAEPQQDAESRQSFFEEESIPDGSYRMQPGEVYPIPVSCVKRRVGKKKKGSKTWLVAAISAILGAFIFSVASPFLYGLIQQTPIAEQFAFPEIPKQTTAAATPVVYNAENRTEMSTVDIGKAVGPSVVGVVSKVSYTGFFSQETASGNGSGIIFTENGYIVTNYHVIEGASAVTVVLNNGQEYEAKLIGGDNRTDIAVIKIEATGLTPAVFGDSDEIEAGEKAIAIGNPLGLEFAGSLTQGIISAINRTVTVDGRTYKMIQTDAAINPGNSGGALVNAYGEVIGINSVKVSSGGVEGLGFAIPISDAKPIIEDLVNFGYVKGRPLIGLTVRYITEQEAYYYNFSSKGLVVVDVSPGSGAEKAGIQKGDIILSCNATEVTSSEGLNEIRDQHSAGDSITVKINRNGVEMDVSIVLGEDTTTAQ